MHANPASMCSFLCLLHENTFTTRNFRNTVISRQWHSYFHLRSLYITISYQSEKKLNKLQKRRERDDEKRRSDRKSDRRDKDKTSSSSKDKDRSKAREKEKQVKKEIGKSSAVVEKSEPAATPADVKTEPMDAEAGTVEVAQIN